MRTFKRRRFLQDLPESDAVMEFNMQVLSSIISTVDCSSLNNSSMKNSLQLIESWFLEMLTTKGKLSLYSEWSPPRDTREEEIHLNRRHTIEFLRGSCSKYSATLGPQLIINRLNNSLTQPGAWPYAKSRGQEGLVIDPNEDGKSRMIIKICSGSPESL